PRGIRRGRHFRLPGGNPRPQDDERLPLRGQVEPEVAVRIALEPLEGAAGHALRAGPVAVAEMVERDRDLDQALEEIARRAAQSGPQVLDGVVALEVEPAVEL